MKWRGRSRWLEATASEVEVVDELAEYMAYCGAARGTRETPIAGKLVAVNFSHKQWAGARPFPDQSREGRNQKGARGRRHPATSEEAAVVRDWKGQQTSGGWAKEMRG